MTARLANKRIVLGVSGGIAAYKSADLIRRLRDAGAEVQVVMTAGGAVLYYAVNDAGAVRQSGACGSA
jgi:phosphopantothenoylcysteine synthetase/decarboxylase